MAVGIVTMPSVVAVVAAVVVDALVITVSVSIVGVQVACVLMSSHND